MSKIVQKNGKLYDIGTKNKSFQQVAIDLKNLGVKNYYFMLEIIDPVVADLDPYSATLTREQISRISVECVRNKWYYLREVARIPMPGGLAMPYSAHRANIAQSWCTSKGLDSDLCIPRQCGKTQSACADIVWGYNFGTTRSQTILLNKDADASKTNLNRIKAQIELLPQYLRYESVMNDETGKLVKEVNNATSMKHPITYNEIIIKGKANSQEAALNIARGLSAPILYFDEIEFTNKIDVIIENSAPVYKVSADNAAKNGGMHARIMTSTPGDLDTPCGEAANNFVQKMPRWSEKLYDMTDEQIKDYILTNGTDRCQVLYIEYSYKQIGKDENWFQEMADSIGNPLTVKREILLQRMRGSDDSPFDRDDIDYLINNAQEPKDELFLLNHFRFDVYKPINKKVPYLVGVDCSTGTNGDNNAMTIIDPYSLEIVAEFACPYIGESDLLSLLVELVKYHIPRAVICIERNSIGDAVIDMALRTSISHRLYFDKNRDYLEESIRNETDTESILKKRAQIKKFYGVYTEGKSREDMISILMRHVHEFKDIMYGRNLVTDICNLVRFSSGKIAARNGKHDDSVMSYLIALYVYYHGNNLPLFGIIKGSKEIENQNEGMKRVSDYPDLEQLVPQGVVEALKRQEEAERNTYEDIFRQALESAQESTKQLVNKNLVVDNVYSNTPDELFDVEDETDIPMSFFSELNN